MYLYISDFQSSAKKQRAVRKKVGCQKVAVAHLNIPDTHCIWSVTYLHFTVSPIYITIIMRNTHLICNNRTMKIQSKSCLHTWGGLKAMFWCTRGWQPFEIGEPLLYHLPGGFDGFAKYMLDLSTFFKKHKC